MLEEANHNGFSRNSEIKQTRPKASNFLSSIFEKSKIYPLRSKQDPAPPLNPPERREKKKTLAFQKSNHDLYKFRVSDLRERFKLDLLLSLMKTQKNAKENKL